MKRIMIIGGNGSGKTTLAKELAEKCNLPLIHIDALYWTGNWQVRPEAEFDEMLLREVEKPRWIIDGNNGRTIPLRLNACDTVIYMDFSSLRCLCGVIKRVLQNYGKSRADMGGCCPERFDFEFIKNAWHFNRNNRRRYYDLLNQKTDVRIILLKNRRQATRFLQSF